MSSHSDVIPAAAVGASGKQDPSKWFLIAGVGCLLAALAWMLLGHNEADPARAFAGWIVGASFWISMLVGILFITMIWWLFDAGWSVVVRRQAEHALAALPWMAAVMLPLFVLAALKSDSGIVTWTWLNPEATNPSGHGMVQNDVLLVAKSAFLNKAALIVRYVVIFAVWGGLATLLRRWSFNMDETGDHSNVHASRKLAAAGIVLCALVTTLAAIDWFKSINYHWFSTMYGVWFFAASMRAGLSALVLICFWQAGRDEGLRGILRPAHTYLIACIMLAFTVFWAYISFSQFFLIYNANIPEETFWYNIREFTATGEKSNWYIVSRLLIYLHFFFPFLFLLWHKNKFGGRLKFIAIWILCLHFVDLLWNILPQKMGDHHSATGYIVRQWSLDPSEVLVFLGAGGICIWAFLRSVARHRPIPIRDPRIAESLHAHE
jgi:hypothetical protein